MSEARALTNLNGAATIVVGKWCGGVDEGQLRSGLGDDPRAPLPAPTTP
jgi:aerobic C4-dicarboxylate transport protein